MDTKTSVLVIIILFISVAAGISVYPTGLTSSSGSFSSQSINVLSTNQLTGTTDTWSTYIEFYGIISFFFF